MRRRRLITVAFLAYVLAFAGLGALIAYRVLEAVLYAGP
jgi:hypothetical protein